MTHFYRLNTINNASQHSNLTWSGSLPEVHHGYGYALFNAAMEEIPLSSPLPHCKLYRAPLIKEEYIQTAHIFKYNGKKAMPEIWGGGSVLLVSERIKEMILSFDDFGHQVLPVTLLDRKKNIIPTETPYYQINIRRFIEIENLGLKLDPAIMEFPANALEERIFPTILAYPTLFNYLSALPLWRLRPFGDAVYLSEAMLNTLQQAGVTGLDPYRNYYGRAYDAIARLKLA